MTNLENLRRKVLSPDLFALWCNGLEYCGGCPLSRECYSMSAESCYESALQWANMIYKEV